MTSLYVFASVLIVSLISLIGIVTITVKESVLRRLLLFFVAFSTGALIGDTVFHLLPEVAEGGFTVMASIAIVLGILLFFVLERVLRWRHCHEVGCEDHPNHLGTLSLASDAVHNIIDGLLIGSTFLVSVPLGIATTVAVLLHEVPQEIGNFGVLLHSGFSRKKALVFNFISALTAFLGAFIAVMIGERAGNFIGFMIPFTAGSFLYIALSDLVPELHKEAGSRQSLLQLLIILLGIGMMVLLLLLE